jgi:hypothetical protein
MAKTVEQALLWGKSSEPGLYYYLVKWYPGFMSAPHWYETDRLCVPQDFRVFHVASIHQVWASKSITHCKRNGAPHVAPEFAPLSEA